MWPMFVTSKANRLEWAGPRNRTRVRSRRRFGQHGRHDMEGNAMHMRFTYIDERDAPEIPVPGIPNKRAEQLVAILTELPEGHVARIHPEQQTKRGLRLSSGRIASKRKWALRTW